MGAIFLSYARDDRACAERLARLLETAGHKVWWDRQLGGGEEFSGEIEAELDKADVVVVAWSKQSIKSRWVRDEAAVGGDMGKLVPVSIDGSPPPLGFRQFHTLDLTGWKGDKRDGRSAELLRSVGRRVEGRTVAVPMPVASGESGLPGRKIWAVAAVLLLLVAGAAAIFLKERGTMRGPASKPTIALLPFTTASPDPELRDLSVQIRESISHTLSQTGIPVRRIDPESGDRGATGDFLLSGELSKNAGKITATIHLDEATQNVTVITEKIEAAGDDVVNLPERVGAQVAGFFDGATLMLLDRRHPIDPALMAEMLAARDDFLGSYQIAKRVAARASDEPNALLNVAFYTAFALPLLPADGRAKAVMEARQAAEKARKLAPKFGDTYVTWCLLHSEALWQDCEDRLREGDRIDPDSPYLNGFLALLLRRVGRLEESEGPARLTYSRDPYSAFKIGGMLRTLELMGYSSGARDLYQKGILWYPDEKGEFAGNRLVGLLDRGDFESADRLAQEVGAEALESTYGDKAAATLNWNSHGAVKQACRKGEGLIFKGRCMLALAKLDDLDSAYAIADQLYARRIGRTPAETERLWLETPYTGVPELFASQGAAAMRRDPRYLQVADRTGLLAYWRGGRPPDFCRKRPEPICRQILKRN